uniref:Uncharacterized protein n=1 Tax=Rhizophora mucronata TaxID=61149 RepID=A0A2P2PXB3_RHIMU
MTWSSFGKSKCSCHLCYGPAPSIPAFAIFPVLLPTGHGCSCWYVPKLGSKTFMC